MNNKGQTLVVFVLLLPLIFMLIATVIEMSRLYITRSEYENSITDTIKYGLDNLDKEDNIQNMQKLIDSNIEGTKEININNDKITIRVTSNMEGMFSKLFKDMYKIDITYTGYLDNGKKKINRN